MTTFEPVTVDIAEHSENAKPKRTLEQVRTGFMWDESFAKRDGTNGYGKPVGDFCERTKDTLGLDPERLIQSIESAMSLATETFNEFYPGGDNRELPYHNDIHARITAAIGIQMFLGALEEMSQNPDYAEHFKKDSGFAMRLAETAVYAYSLHEYKDWWTKGHDEKKVENWDANLKTKLEEKGIDVNDLGIILELDNAFADKTLAYSVKKTFQSDFKPEFDLGNDFERLSIISGIDDNNFEVAVLNAYGACIRSADFSQIFNSGYEAQFILVDEGGREIGSKNASMGSVILADEFSRKRPKALPKEWKDKDGEVLWANVGFEKGFYEGMAKPNIMYGIEFMRQVNENQYNGMKKAMAKIEGNF